MTIYGNVYSVTTERKYLIPYLFSTNEVSRICKWKTELYRTHTCRKGKKVT